MPSHAVLQPDWVQLHQPYGWHVSTDESNCHFHCLDSRTINRSEGVLSHLFLWLMLHGSQNTRCVPWYKIASSISSNSQYKRKLKFTSKVKCNIGLNRWCLSSPYSICGQLIIKVNTYILRIGLNDIEFKCSIDW